MPPAGADLATWVPEEEPQPIGVSMLLPPGSILPGTEVQPGCWDAKAGSWSSEGMSPVTNPDSSGPVSFQTKTVGCLAVLERRTALLPYQDWHLRPSGDRPGHEAILQVVTGDCATNMLATHLHATQMHVCW